MGIAVSIYPPMFFGIPRSHLKTSVKEVTLVVRIHAGLDFLHTKVHLLAHLIPLASLS